MVKARNKPYTSTPNRELVSNDARCVRNSSVSVSGSDTHSETNDSNDIVVVRDSSAEPDTVLAVRDSSAEPDNDIVVRDSSEEPDNAIVVRGSSEEPDGIIYVRDHVPTKKRTRSLTAQVRQLDSTIRRNTTIRKECDDLIERTTRRKNEANKRIRSSKKALHKLDTEQQLSCEQSQQTMQQTIQQAVQQEVQKIMKQEAQQAVQQAMQQPAQKPDQVPPLELVQVPAQELIQVLQQDPVQVTTKEPTQQSEHQQEEQPVQQPTQHSGHSLACQSSRWLEKQPESILEPGGRPTSTGDDGNVFAKHVVSELLPTTESNVQSSSSVSPKYPEVYTSRLQYRLDHIITVKRTSPECPPRRALVHQFDGVDNQTVISYGSSRLQFWDSAEREIVAEWNGGHEGIRIEQVEPASSSMLAIVSSDGGKNDPASKAGRLFFMDVDGSTDGNHLSYSPIRKWVGGSHAAMDISVVERIRSESVGDDNQISLFTGGIADGMLYRRLFDISGGEVTELTKELILNRYRGHISALCHIPDRKAVIVGTTAGGLCMNDHVNGKYLKSFSLSESCMVGSITGCPFNPNLFMVGCHYPLGEILIFDTRDPAGNGSPVVTAIDFNSTMTSRYCRPAWNPNNGLIFVPVQREVDGMNMATVNVLDIRYVKISDGEPSVLYEDESNVFSVDFTNPTRDGRSEMVTASELSIGFSSLSISKHQPL